MIEGLRRIPLAILGDHRGAVLPMLRADRPPFERFGEIYFSLVRAGQVKGWNLHRRVTCNLAVVAGAVRFLFVDGRGESGSRCAVVEERLSRDDYALLVVPPGLWMCFGALGAEDGLIANCATEPHDPAELERRALDDPQMPRWSAR